MGRKPLSKRSREEQKAAFSNIIRINEFGRVDLPEINKDIDKPKKEEIDYDDILLKMNTGQYKPKKDVKKGLMNVSKQLIKDKYQDNSKLVSPNEINRFYQDKEYIGVKKKQKNSFGEWENSTQINVFKGKPYNKHEYDLIGEYSDSKWKELVKLIEIEANNKGKEVINDKLNRVVYSVNKIVSKPKDILDKQIGSRAVEISLPSMKEFLTKEGFTLHKRDEKTEWVGNKLVNNKSGVPYLVRVYTSVNPEDRTRGYGTDAIRVGVFDRFGSWMYGSPHVKRTINWKDNVMERIETLTKRVKSMSGDVKGRKE